MSGRSCSACSDARRPELDAAVAAGESFRAISRRFAPLSRDAIRRHRPHVGAAIVRAAARKGERLDDALLGKARAREADAERFEESLLQKVSRLEEDARRLGEKAETEGDLRCALAAVRELLDTVKLMHELMPAPTPSAAEVRAIMEKYAAEVGVSVDEFLAEAELLRWKIEGK